LAETSPCISIGHAWHMKCNGQNHETIMAVAAVVRGNFFSGMWWRRWSYLLCSGAAAAFAG
jgi:hypothetical protein